MEKIFSYRMVKRGDIALLDVHPLPDWQEFETFVSQFMEDSGAQLIEYDTGMDRHQVRYRYKGHQYVLQFEHYSQSIWIEQDY